MSYTSPERRVARTTRRNFHSINPTTTTTTPATALHTTPLPSRNPRALLDSCDRMLSAVGNPRQLATQLLNFGMILSTAFMVSATACHLDIRLSLRIYADLFFY
jgi:hypothetical protein